MLISIRKIAQFTTPYRSKLIIGSYRSWLKEKEKILDIGCGNGISTETIATALRVDAAGCDIEKNIVVRLPFSIIPKSGKLPFKKNSFDAAMINDVLHHIDKQYQISIIKEALRVAKKVLIFEAEPTLSGKIFDMILNKLHYRSLRTPLTFRRRKEWIEIFRKMGLNYETKAVKASLWYPFVNISMMVKEKRNK